MPGAKIVGRVAIKIIPDTSEFKNEAKSELERAGRGLEVTAEVNLDTTGVKEQAKKIKEEVQSVLQDINLDINLDNEGSLKAAITRVRAELGKLGSIDLPIDINEASLNAALELLNEQLDHIRSIHIEVDESSQSSIRAAIARIDAELSGLRSVEIDVKVDEGELNALREMLTKDLRLELKLDYDDDASIQAAVEKINQELKAIDEVKLDVKLDRASLLKAKEDLKSLLEARAQVKLDVDRAEAQRVHDEIKALVDDVKISTKLDARAVRKTKRELEIAFTRMAELKAKITPEIDALAKAKVEREIDELQDKIDDLKAEIKPETSKAGTALVMAEMARLARSRIVNLYPKVSSTAAASALATLKALSGYRVLSSMFEKIGRSIRKLDKSVPMIGSMAAAIAGLSGWLLSAASNMFSLSSSLAQIGPTFALLPGLIGGFAVGLGVTIAAFSDFNKKVPEAKKALSGLQDVISNNFWDKAQKPIREFVTDLLPQFRSGVEKTATELGTFFGNFATDLKGKLGPSLGQMFKDLSDSINIASGGTKAFSAIIADLGKVGTSYLPRLAQWFVDISDRFANFLARKGESGIKQEVDEGIEALKDLGGVLKHVYGIFSAMNRAATAAGGSTLDTLNQKLKSIEKTMDSPGFQNDMTAVFMSAHEAMDNISGTSGPAFTAFLDRLVMLMTDVLPKAGLAIGTTFRAVFSGLADEGFMGGVTAIFDGLLAAVQILEPAMVPIAKALGALGEIVGAMLPAFAEVVKVAIIPLADAVVYLSPFVIELVKILSGGLRDAIIALTPFFEKLVPIIGDGLAAAADWLAEALPPIVDAFKDMAPIVGGVILAAFGALKEILPPLSDIFMSIYENVKPLVEKLMEAAKDVFPVVADSLKRIAEAAAPVIDTIMRIWKEALEPLIPMLADLIKDYLPKFVDAFKRIEEAIQPFLDALLAVVQFIMPVLVPVIKFLIELFLDSLLGAINGVALVLEGFVEVCKGVWDTLIGYFKFILGIFVGIFTGNFDLLKEGWNQLWTGVWEFVKGIWDMILGAVEFVLNVGIVGSIGKGMKAIWKLIKSGWKLVDDVFKGAWSAIRGGFDAFINAIVGFCRNMMSNAKGAISSGWTAVKRVFSDAYTAIKTAIPGFINDVVQFFKDLPGKITTALGKLGELLVQAGKDLVQGLINGMSGMLGAAVDFAKGLGGKIKSGFKSALGIKSPSRVFRGYGKNIVEGLIVGLDGQRHSLLSAVDRFSEVIAGTTIDGPTIGDPKFSGDVSSAIGGALAYGSGSGVKVLNYYAAAGSSINAEEDLFTAGNRARMGW